VIKKSNCDEIYDGLPVWIVDDWSEFNSTNLLTKIQHFSNTGRSNNKLYLSYWINEINGYSLKN
jgi:hypothetical protein